MNDGHYVKQELAKVCKNCKHSSPLSKKQCEFRRQITPYYDKAWNKEITREELWEKRLELEDALTCKEYSCAYIEFPLTLENVFINNINYNKGLGHNVGCLVAIKPCSESKTYLGIYLGDLPQYISLGVDKDNLMRVSSRTNPAIYVFDLQKIIFGSQSWWHELKSVDDLKDITDKDIDNTWYVKLLKGMMGREK